MHFTTTTTTRQRARASLARAGLLVAAFALACAPGDRGSVSASRSALSAGAHTLSGTVFGGGQAMPAVLVEALSDGAAVVGSSTTDSAGGYAIALDDGTYDLRVTPPAGVAFGPQAIRNVVVAGADKREDIILIAAGGVVGGRVRGYGGVELGGTTVVIQDPATWVQVASATADGDGRFQVNLGPGAYQIYVSAPYPRPTGAPGGYWYMYLYNQAISGTTTLNIDLPVAKVQGIVADASGTPVPGASVSANASGSAGGAASWYGDGSAQTDANGHYELLVVTGNNTFKVTPPAPLGTLVQSAVGIDGDVTRDFVLAEVTPISGQVRGYGGLALGGTTVVIQDPATWAEMASATADGDGRFQINLGPGTYQIYVSAPYPRPAGAPGGYWYMYLYNQTISETTTLNIDLPVAKVQGVATDANGAPVPGASVSTNGSGSAGGAASWYGDGNTQTDASGHYELLVVTGNNTFKVTPPAPLGTLVQSAVGIDGDVTRDFVLAEVAPISGQVRGYGGLALGGTTVVIQDPATWAEMASATADADGRFQLNLAPGTYQVYVSAPYPRPAGAPGGYWYMYLYNQTISGTALNIDLPVAKVQGVATDANGAPVPGVSVSANGYGSAGSAASWYGDGGVQTNAEGRYELMIVVGTSTFTVAPPAASGFSTTVLSNVPVASDFAQRIVLQQPDLSPPVIVSGPSVVHLSDTSVSVRWQTNEPADSIVDYGVGELSDVASNATLVSTHEVTLLGLSPSTLYQYRVGSRDASGNGPTRSPASTFTTHAPPGDITPPVIIGGPTVTGIGQTTAIVTWRTDEPSSTVVRYGTSAALGSAASIAAAFTTEHQIALAGLAPSTTYFFRVESTDPDGNGPTASALGSFTTAAVPDTQPPVIVAGPEVAATTNTTVTVVWTTDEPASSGVSYNDGTRFFVVNDDKLSTAHVVVLAGLAPQTTYSITVSSSDQAGNGPTLGGPVSATTLATTSNSPPAVTVPSDMVAEATGAGGAPVTFSASASDAEDGALAAICTPPSGATFPLGATAVTCAATDTGGATTSSTFTVTVIDTTPPVFTREPAGTTAFATCAADTRVRYVPPAASDAVSGSVPVSCAPPPRSLFPVGTTEITCTARDAAGNHATTTFVVKVVYEAPTDGRFFLPPIEHDGTGVHRRGAALPVKFRLTGASAHITDLRARLYVAPVAGGVPGAYEEANGRGASNAGNLFRYDRSDRLYIFNLDTRGLGAGTWSLKADLGDGVPRTVNVNIAR